MWKEKSDFKTHVILFIMFNEGMKIMEDGHKLKSGHEQILAGMLIFFEELKTELIDYKQKANYWESQFYILKKKQDELQKELEEIKAHLRKREHQLFGGKSERSAKNQKQAQESTKSRGHQKGACGHGRRDYKDLPIAEETVEIADADKYCPCCGLPYELLNTTEDSEILEVINVSAYKRVIKRNKYKRCCQCKNLPRLITAPLPKKLLPKSKIGVSIWSLLLIQKYEYQCPVYRELKQLEATGISLAMGTVIDGFKKLVPLLSPIYDGIVEHNIISKHWHADETGWKVFESVEDKHSSRWYLWIFANTESVVYKLDPSRSSKVLLDHFGEESGGTLNVDRYSAYKAIAKRGLFILAFCWAHVRRDFISYARSYPALENWAFDWVRRIGKLYMINNKRITNETGSKEYKINDVLLKTEIKEFHDTANKQLEDDSLAQSAKKLLSSLNNHWGGLTVFAEHPDIPMDNNTAERGLRNSVVGRKNYYGSSVVWSGELAAIMFTIFETIKRWKLNPHTWLINYLQACANNNGAPPKSIPSFLPWNMTEQQKELFTKPPDTENSS
jgi:transposase